MGNTSASIFNLLSFLLLIQIGFLVDMFEAQPFTALYTFGDSNMAPQSASSGKSHMPYGIDLPYHLYHVGFSNGLSISDFLDDLLGFKPGIPYLEADDATKMNGSESGFNYAYGSATIRPPRGPTTGLSMEMARQVNLFEETLYRYIETTVENKTLYLSLALFAVSIGNNDLMHLVPRADHNETKFDLYLDHLMGNLTVQFKRLYELGARRFLVFNIGPLGCYPIWLTTTSDSKAKCNEDINRLVSLYNGKLADKMDYLNCELSSSTFTIANTYKLVHEIINTRKYGFSDVTNSCCPVQSPGGFCVHMGVPCLDRKKTLFWDKLHLTEAANKILVTKCYSGDGDICFPWSIRDLQKTLVSESSMLLNVFCDLIAKF
ncbi:GDSL lipase/esterase [Dillenia turbinata]|uniref:GDSL lipase/esterase n=1 Tax=Dillenia turbinata TaxID=194707 RepID=A0AAN8UQA2_9MAGN